MADIQEKLLQMVENLTAKVEHLEAMQSDLWGAEEIASLLKIKVASVQQSVINRNRCPSFPKAKVIPTGGRRWLRDDVIAWAKALNVPKPH